MLARNVAEIGGSLPLQSTDRNFLAPLWESSWDSKFLAGPA